MTRDRLQYIKSYIDSGPDIKGTVMYFILDEVVTALEAAWEERDDANTDRQALACQVEAAKREIGRVAERDKDILHGGEVKDSWRDVAQERLSQCSRLNLLLNKSERECCDLKLALHKVECERDKFKQERADALKAGETFLKTLGINANPLL